MAESLQSRVIATIVRESFDDFHHEFRGVTQRARSRFERREWQDAQADAVERLDLHDAHVRTAVRRLADELGAVARREVWTGAKASYARWVTGRDDFEIAETFFNDVTHGVFSTTGVDAALEFAWYGASSLPRGTDNRALFEVHQRPGTTLEMVRSILAAYELQAPFADLEGDARAVTERLEARLLEVWDPPPLDTIDMLRPVFFRNKGAYLIGRVRARNRIIPFILPLLHTPNGIVVDAVLLSERDASRSFSITRSHFHVDWANPAELVGFLKSLLPMKPIAELFSAIGYTAHGRTMLYRSLRRHLDSSSDRFELAPGARGRVMTVFTLPSYDVVFKVIKDRPDPPKTITAREVREKYRLVSRHDRAGRMVDALEFANVVFDRDRFSEPLVAELLARSPRSVGVTDRHVVVSSLYAERRLHPLDLYLRDVRPDRARQAVVEYGRALKDLAAADIHPGDVSTKNFGVTRNGSVVFYDYDQIRLLSTCRVHAGTSGDEPGAHPDDIVPEDLLRDSELPRSLQDVFVAEHGDLLDAKFWTAVQERNADGDVIDVFPYPQELRFAR